MEFPLIILIFVLNQKLKNMNRKLLVSIVGFMTLCLFMVVGCSSTTSNEPNEPKAPKQVYTYVIHYSTDNVNDTISGYSTMSDYVKYTERDFINYKDTRGFQIYFNKFNIVKIERIQ